MRKRRLSEIGQLRVWRVVYKVRAAATVGIAPNMLEVEPMPYLVHGRSTHVEWRRRAASRAEGGIENDHAISVRRHARKLCVTEQPAADRADPNVQVFIAGPGIGAAPGRGFNRIVLPERDLIRLCARDSTGRIAIRIRCC